MPGHPKDVIADLMAGTLPWPQAKRIMSSYKDADRFQKAIEVLQESVPWDEPIVLPVGESLFIVRTRDGCETRCRCGHGFGDHRRNWKLSALIRIRKTPEDLGEIYPHSDVCDGDWMELREFICPGCATLLEVEACAPGYPVIHDFEPDLEGFYREWLGIPFPSPPGPPKDGK